MINSHSFLILFARVLHRQGPNWTAPLPSAQNHPSQIEWHPYQLNLRWLPARAVDRKELSSKHMFGGPRRGRFGPIAQSWSAARRPLIYEINLQLSRAAEHVNSSSFDPLGRLEGRQQASLLRFFRALFQTTGGDDGAPRTLMQDWQAAGMDPLSRASVASDADLMRPAARGHPSQRARP